MIANEPGNNNKQITNKTYNNNNSKQNSSREMKILTT